MTDTNRRPFLPGVAGLLTVMAILLGHGHYARSAPALEGVNGKQAASGGTVILELFTSQGCSSCPAADRLLTRLGAEQMVEGVTMIPLAFHVDYWNYIGWTDPFSSKEWSRRQESYALAFGLNTLYTPQLVINGRHELVGSDQDRVRHSIPLAATPASAATVTLAIDPHTLTRGSLQVESHARLAEDLEADHLEGMLAVFENGLVTPVRSGENARKNLRNDSVVRTLVKAFDLPGNAGAERRRVLDLVLQPEWTRSNLGIAAFLQDPDSLAIHGAAAILLKDYL